MVATPSDGKKGGITPLVRSPCQSRLSYLKSLRAGGHRVWLSVHKTGKIDATFRASPFAQDTAPSAMKNFWRHCLTHLQGELPQQQYRSWIEPLHCAVDGRVVTLTAPNRFVLQWVRDRFLPRIQELADTELGVGIELRLSLREKGAAATPATVIPPEPAAPRSSVRDVSRLNPAFTFDTFVTGKANELARAAAAQVAERPGIAYNPLFIYGGVGLGKTHLIHAIGNAVLARARQQDPLHTRGAVRLRCRARLPAQGI